jgi:hypothetical protein
MAAKYFWGANIKGKVVASPAATFKELIGMYVSSPVTLPVAQKSYHAMDDEGQKEIKTQLPYLTAATFTDSPSPRKFEHAEKCNLIFLDIDVEKDGSCPAAPFVKNPHMLAKHLAPFAFAAYVTTSSTAEKPRLRIMVAADSIPIEMYPHAVATIAQRIGLPVVTRESKTAVQPMFLPSMFSDMLPDFEHPMIIARVDGAEFKESDIDLDDELLPHAKPYTPKVVAAGEDCLAYLRAPVAEITLEMAKDALTAIDVDSLEYQEWLDMAFALRHQFSPKLVEEAYQLFDEWSSEGEKYNGPEETIYKWNSTSSTPLDRAPVTIRTLLHKAVEHGWQSQVVKEKCFAATMAWIQDDARTQTELMSASLQKIAGTPLLSHTEEDALLNATVAQAKKLHNIKISISGLRTDLKKLKDAANKKDDKEKPDVPQWLKGICYVSKTNEFFKPHTTEDWTPEAFNNVFSRKLLPTEEQLREAGLPVTPSNMAKPLVRPQEFALNFHNNTTMVVYDKIYDPAHPNKTFRKYEGRFYVNTYRKTYPEPSEEGANKAELILRGHLRMLIAEQEYIDHILDWLAYNVQFPGRKIRHAIFIQGGEGCGKTFLYNLLAAVLGTQHVKKINKGTLEKGWTEWAYGSQIIAVEEIRVVGHNRHDVMNVLKELITNDDAPINKRNTSTMTMPNLTNYLLFSNFHDALALTEGDRRYFVIKSRLQTKEQIKALEDSGHFVRLFEMLENHASGLRYFFENYKIRDSFKPNGHAPRTVYADQIIDDVCDEVTATIKKFLADGIDPLVQHDLIAATALADKFTIEGLKKPSGPHMASVLRTMGYQQVGRWVVNADAGRDGRQYLWLRVGELQGVVDYGEFIRQRVADRDELGALW